MIETFLASPLYVAYVCMLGLIFGSFLNVYLYRFHTGKSLGGSSHCLSCGKFLAWFELVPLLSYVALRGKCRGCRSYIPPRYFIVEITTAAMFWLAVATEVLLPLQVLTAAFLTVLVAIMVYDYYHTIIPDEFTIALCVLAFTKLGYLAYSGVAVSELFYMLLAGAAAAGPFFFLWVVSGGRWIGLGDAKLAFPLGVWMGLSSVVSMVMWSFWIGAGVSLLLMGTQQFLRRGKMDLRLFGRPLTMKSEIPFAPFLIAGFVAVHFFSLSAFSLLSYGL